MLGKSLLLFLFKQLQLQIKKKTLDNSFFIFYWLGFLFFVSGYDFVILNDENLLLNIFIFIFLVLFLKLNDFLENFNMVTKTKIIKEYYYKFYLIKIFYLIYMDYLKYNFLLYYNYYKYYNYYANNVNNLLISFNTYSFTIYLKFFLNYLNNFINLIALKFINLKFLTIINVNYLIKISKFLNLSSK